MADENNLFNIFTQEAENLQIRNGEDTNLAEDPKLVNALANMPELEEESEHIEEEDQEEEEDLDEQEENLEDYQEDEIEEEVQEGDGENYSLYEAFAVKLIDDGVLQPRTNEDGELEEIYDDSPEGLRLMVEHTVEQRVEEVKEELASIVLNPSVGATVADLIEYIQNGGDPKEFFDTTTSVNYAELDETIESNQELLIREKLALDGLEEEEIDELVEDYKVAGNLGKQALVAQKALIRNQQAEFERLKQEQLLARQAEIEEQARQEEEFRNKIFSLNSIGNIPVTERDKQKFYDYLTKPVKKTSSGEKLTQYEIDVTNDKRFELAFIMFKGGIGSIEKKVQTESSKNLKLALSKSKDTMLSRNSQVNESEEVVRRKTKIVVPTPDFL